MQADTNEVMAASVVYLSNVDVDRPLSKAAWNNSQALRHFSILRKLDGAPFPAGAPSNPPLKRVESLSVARHGSAVSTRTAPKTCVRPIPG